MEFIRCMFTLLSFITIASCGAASAVAQQLRIETEVFSGEKSEPISRAITLFDGGAVYHFVDRPHQIVVFRPPSSSRDGQFHLLDVDSHQRTDVKTERIEGLMDKLTRWAANQDDKMLKFSANPEFEETFDSARGQLTLEHDLWRYTVATVPAESKHSLTRYREFVDWYSRLNAMVSGSPPPGPRLALNAALEKHGAVPVEIHRKTDSIGKPLRATHLFSWRVSRDDRARLDQAREYLTSFEKVDNKKFFARRDGPQVVRGQSR